MLWGFMSTFETVKATGPFVQAMYLKSCQRMEPYYFNPNQYKIGIYIYI